MQIVPEYAEREGLHPCSFLKVLGDGQTMAWNECIIKVHSLQHFKGSRPQKYSIFAEPFALDIARVHGWA